MKKLLLGIGMLLVFNAVFAQEEATTESGKKVILYSNGTWKYKEEEKDKKGIKEKPETVKTEKKATEPVKTVITGDCAGKFESTQDKNNTITTKTKNLLIVSNASDNKEINISMQKGAKGILSISFRAIGGGDCIGEGNKIAIQFTDGSKLDLTNDGPTNCRGESIASFYGPFAKKKQAEELKTKRIKSVKVWTQQSSVTQEFSKEAQEEFVQLLNCLVNI